MFIDVIDKHSDVDYVVDISHLLFSESTNVFADWARMYESLVFDWLIGNCDNHLKNYSLIYSPDWSQVALTPRYDITCVPLYPVELEMGIPLCQSRRINDVKLDDLLSSGKKLRQSSAHARDAVERLAQSLPKAIELACERLVAAGFCEAETVARAIVQDVLNRTQRMV